MRTAPKQTTTSHKNWPEVHAHTNSKHKQGNLRNVSAHVDKQRDMEGQQYSLCWLDSTSTGRKSCSLPLITTGIMYAGCLNRKKDAYPTHLTGALTKHSHKVTPVLDSQLVAVMPGAALTTSSLPPDSSSSNHSTTNTTLSMSPSRSRQL